MQEPRAGHKVLLTPNLNSSVWLSGQAGPNPLWLSTPRPPPVPTNDAVEVLRGSQPAPSTDASSAHSQAFLWDHRTIIVGNTSLLKCFECYVWCSTFWQCRPFETQKRVTHVPFLWGGKNKSEIWASFWESALIKGTLACKSHGPKSTLFIYIVYLFLLIENLGMGYL